MYIISIIMMMMMMMMMILLSVEYMHITIREFPGRRQDCKQEVSGIFFYIFFLYSYIFVYEHLFSDLFGDEP